MSGPPFSGTHSIHMFLNKAKTYCVVFVSKYPGGQTFCIIFLLKFCLYPQDRVAASGIFMVGGGSSCTSMGGMKFAPPKGTKHWKRI